MLVAKKTFVAQDSLDCGRPQALIYGINWWTGFLKIQTLEWWYPNQHYTILYIHFKDPCEDRHCPKLFFWWLASLNIPYFGGWHPIWHEGKQVFNPLGIWRHPVWHEGQILSLHIVWTSPYLTKTPASHPTIAIRNEMCSFVIGPYTACKCKSRKCQELTCKNE